MKRMLAAMSTTVLVVRLNKRRAPADAGALQISRAGLRQALGEDVPRRRRGSSRSPAQSRPASASLAVQSAAPLVHEGE